MNNTKILEKLHEHTALLLLQKIESGAATAAELSAAIRFLKDNGIECIPTPENPIGELASRLPEFTDEDLGMMN